MDFDFGEDINALRDLSGEILDDYLSTAPLEDSDSHMEAYSLLAQSGVFEALLPERLGGTVGIGMLGAHQVLEQVGRRAIHIPVWESAVLSALVLARHGSPEQQERWLPTIAGGSTIFTAALVESGNADPRQPSCLAQLRGHGSGGWALTGVKTQVPFVRDADRILVSATTADGYSGVFLVDPSAPGLLIEDQSSVSRRPMGMLALNGVSAEPIGDFDATLADALRVGQAALAALQLGNCAAALQMAAEYTSTREQFGHPISDFQAVRQRLADAFIDVEAMRLTSAHACEAISTGRAPDHADRAVTIAAFWAADGAHRVLSTAQHVHGGIGIDLEYGLHKHFRLGKHLEFTLGSASAQLRRLGRRFAETTERAQGELSLTERSSA